MSGPLAWAQRLAQRARNRLFLGRTVFAEIQRVRAELEQLRAAYEQLREAGVAKRDAAPNVEELKAACSQLQDVVAEMGGLPPPPRHLQVRVVGGYSPDFLKSGRGLVDDLNAVLAGVGRTLRSFDTVLDFGCGCARVLRPLSREAAPAQRLCGTDIDAEAIEWCRAHYGGIAEFGVNPVMPPMDYSEAAFDLVYSVSIFTHLPEDMQFAWLAELRRITRPGGYLVLSVHGRNHYCNLPPEALSIMHEKGFYYRATGTTAGLPEFYQTTYHSQAYVRARWSDYFDVLDIRELAISNWQDAVLCRRR